MEKKILQTNQCPFCFNKIDIRATKCDKCRSDLTTKEAQDKIRKIFEEQKNKKDKEENDKITKNNQQNSHKIKILFYVVLFIIFIILSSLKAIGFAIFFALVAVFVIYQDKVFSKIDKNYKILERNKFQKTIRKVITGFLVFASLMCLISFIQEATESPESKLAKQKIAQEQALKENEARQKAAEEAQRLAQEKAKQDLENKKADVIKQLNDQLTLLTAKQNIKAFDKVDGIGLMIGYFKGTVKLMNDAEKNYPDNEEIKKLITQIKPKLKERQRVMFPMMRKDFAKIIGSTVWENDIEVKAFGTGNSTLDFNGYSFASNKNIKDFYSPLYDSIKDLRFDTVNFKWSDYAKYTYYTLESPKDTDLVE